MFQLSVAAFYAFTKPYFYRRLGESYRGQFGIPIFGWRQTMPNHSAEEQFRLLP
jgi:hypothetical protein